MGVKTKVFSLIVLVLLALPIFIGPQKNAGQVLGTSENQSSVYSSPEKNSPNFDLINSSPQLKQSKIGEIGSGASEVVSKNVVVGAKIYKGRVIWEDNAKGKVVSDKFPKGSGIQVKYNQNTVPLVVEDSRILSSDTVLVVNKETFIKLGGNPETASFIEVEAIS